MGKHDTTNDDECRASGWSASAVPLVFVRAVTLIKRGQAGDKQAEKPATNLPPPLRLPIFGGPALEVGAKEQH